MFYPSSKLLGALKEAYSHRDFQEGYLPHKESLRFREALIEELALAIPVTSGNIIAPRANDLVVATPLALKLNLPIHEGVENGILGAPSKFYQKESIIVVERLDDYSLIKDVVKQVGDNGGNVGLVLAALDVETGIKKKVENLGIDCKAILRLRDIHQNLIS